MEKNTIESLGFHRDGKILIIDDKFEVSEEVKNMSHEERQRRIFILEEAARKEAENIPDPKLLMVV